MSDLGFLSFILVFYMLCISTIGYAMRSNIKCVMMTLVASVAGTAMIMVLGWQILTIYDNPHFTFPQPKLPFNWMCK